MSQGDLLVDRKRLKSHLTTWRALAIIALVAVAALLLQSVDGPAGSGVPGRDYVAQISVGGIIQEDADREALLKKIRDDNSAKALIVRMDSPGGTTVGGEELFLQLRDVAKKKPVVGVMGTVCASACYMSALGTDHLIARQGTLTGSIGVLLQSLEVSRLADKLGITPITIKSGKYKDAPSLTEPLTDDERRVVNEVVMDAYDYFVGLIADRRGMSKDHVRELGDGRVYTGRQAIDVKLIDELGGNDEARAWLSQKHKVSPELNLKIMDKKPEYESLFSHLSQWTGIEIFDSMTVGLDGLVSIWHPSTIQ